MYFPIWTLDNFRGGSDPLCHMGPTCVQADKRLVSPQLCLSKGDYHRVCRVGRRTRDVFGGRKESTHNIRLPSSPGLVGLSQENGINCESTVTRGDVLLGKSKSSSPKRAGKGRFAFGKPRVPALGMWDAVGKMSSGAATLNGVMCFAMRQSDRWV